MKKRNGKRLPLRGFEQLETREMLSGLAVCAAAAQKTAPIAVQVGKPVAPVAAQVAKPVAAQVAKSVAPLAHKPHVVPAASQQTVLSAQLTDPNSTTATGMVSYRAKTVNSVTTPTKFTVAVRGAAADTTLDVIIDPAGFNYKAGTITTDSTGAGRLQLVANPDADDTDVLPLPADFPALAADTVITVGTLSGSLATKLPGPPAPSPVQRTALGASLTDPNSTTAAGKVMYHTMTVKGVTSTKFMVVVRGAAPDSELHVIIDPNGANLDVGTITTDANGAGTLKLVSNPDDSDEAPLPANFPTSLAADTVISVGTLSGSLSTLPPPPWGHGGHGPRK